MAASRSTTSWARSTPRRTTGASKGARSATVRSRPSRPTAPSSSRPTERRMSRRTPRTDPSPSPHPGATTASTSRPAMAAPRTSWAATRMPISASICVPRTAPSRCFAADARSGSGAEQHLCGPAFVHRRVGLRYLLEGKLQVEDAARVDGAREHLLHELLDVTAHGGDSAAHADVALKETPHGQLGATSGHADVAHHAAGPRGANRLVHRLLRADTLEHAVGADPIEELADASDPLVATLRHDVGRAELAGDLLAVFVARHRDNSARAESLRGEHGAEPDGPVADDHDRLTGTDAGRDCRVVAGAHDVGKGQHARDQVLIGMPRGDDERAVGVRHPDALALGSAGEMTLAIGGTPPAAVLA